MEGRMTTVRYRSPTGVRSLGHMSFAASEAKYDRLKVQIRVRLGYADLDQISTYLSHIGGEGGFLPAHVFDLRSDRTPHTRKIYIRDGFLFGGAGKIKNIASRAGGTAEINMTLDLNPTRFLAHQPSGRLGTAEDVYAGLAVDPEHTRPRAATALDGNDNILMGFLQNGGTTFEHRETWWDGVMREYLARLERLLRFNLEPSADNGLPPVRVDLEFGSLQQAEVYWEGTCSDAVSWVLSLADRAYTAAGQMQLRRYFPDARQFQEGHNENGVSLAVEMKPSSGDVRLCIYAKSATRVRFEVRYLVDVRGTVAARQRGTFDAIQLLNFARQDASNRMTRFNQAIDQLATASFDRSDLLALLEAISWAVDHDKDAARALMSPLINVGAVSETPAGGGVAPRSVLDRLSARGIVNRIQLRRGGIRRYALTPTYAAVAQALIDVLPDRQALAAERASLPIQ
jgi:hypothetical protein